MRYKNTMRIANDMTTARLTTKRLFISHSCRERGFCCCSMVSQRWSDQASIKKLYVSKILLRYVKLSAPDRRRWLYFNTGGPRLVLSVSESRVQQCSALQTTYGNEDDVCWRRATRDAFFVRKVIPPASHSFWHAFTLVSLRGKGLWNEMTNRREIWKSSLLHVITVNLVLSGTRK